MSYLLVGKLLDSVHWSWTAFALRDLHCSHFHSRDNSQTAKINRLKSYASSILTKRLYLDSFPYSNNYWNPLRWKNPKVNQNQFYFSVSLLHRLPINLEYTAQYSVSLPCSIPEYTRFSEYLKFDLFFPSLLSHYLTMDNQNEIDQPADVYPYVVWARYCSVFLTLNAVLHLLDSNSAEQS